MIFRSDVLPGPVQLAKTKKAGRAPVDPASWSRDASWLAALDRLLTAVDEAALPEPARQARDALGKIRPGDPATPDSARNLLQAIEAQNGSVAVTGPLGLLRLGAVVPAVRNEVLTAIQPLRKSQNLLIAAGANEVFSFWATQEQTEELRELATSKELSQVAARRLALQTLIGFGTPTLDPAVVSSLDDLIYSNEIQQALIKLGGNAEGPILQAWPMVTTAAGKRVLIEVLGQVGGEPSIQLLQQLAESPDREVRIPATLAVKKIQSRR